MAVEEMAVRENLGREVLPPCVRRVHFDGRNVTLNDYTQCSDVLAHRKGAPADWHFAVYTGYDSAHPVFNDHAGVFAHDANGVVYVHTNDPAEAEAAWERAERWVRTGE